MQFDTTLKELFQTLPHRLVEQLCGSRVVELLTVEQPSVKTRRPDLVARLRFDYDVIDSREIDSRPLLASDSLSDNLIAILCKVDDLRAVSRRILKKLATLPSKQAKDAVVKLAILSKLRRAEKIVIEEVRKLMPLTREDLLELPMISELMLFGEQQAEERGEKKGEKKGKREEARKLLSTQLEYRFGALPDWVKQEIAAANLRTLERWSLRLLKADSLEEVLK